MPILIKLSEAYKLWHTFLIQFPRLSKYTLGGKIDALLLETIELTLKASYAPSKQKLLIVQTSGIKLDTVKFLLQIAWEMKLLSHDKYQAASTPLAETGKMLGGWLKYLEKQTPPEGGE